MSATLSDFESLWTTEKGQYVLVQVGDEPLDCVIEEASTHAALLIEDDEIYFEVIRRMRDAGVPVVSADSDS